MSDSDDFRKLCEELVTAQEAYEACLGLAPNAVWERLRDSYEAVWKALGRGRLPTQMKIPPMRPIGILNGGAGDPVKRVHALEKALDAHAHDPVCGHHSEVWYTARNTLKFTPRPDSPDGCILCEIADLRKAIHEAATALLGALSWTVAGTLGAESLLHAVEAVKGSFEHHARSVKGLERDLNMVCEIKNRLVEENEQLRRKAETPGQPRAATPAVAAPGSAHPDSAIRLHCVKWNDTEGVEVFDSEDAAYQALAVNIEKGGKGGWVKHLVPNTLVATERSRANLAEARLASATNLADEVDALVRRGVVDARSPVADALLDFRNPPSTTVSRMRAAMDTATATAVAADRQSSLQALRTYEEVVRKSGAGLSDELRAPIISTCATIAMCRDLLEIGHKYGTDRVENAEASLIVSRLGSVSDQALSEAVAGFDVGPMIERLQEAYRIACARKLSGVGSITGASDKV